ncbi:MAG TPA: cell division protein ZapA [Xanthobacteraceae bacterium]|nr:cell division protein ZapA [Xanthobacteraceae bacterium]
MAQLNVTINGRQFRMACEDGQEEHLVRLARDFNDRINTIRAQFGEVGDMRLTIMAALTMGDELSDAFAKIKRLEEEIAALQDARLVAADRAQATEAAIVKAFGAAAERIEKVAKALNQPQGGGAANGVS